MNMTFSDFGIHAVNIDDKIAFALCQVARIKIHSTCKLSKLHPNRYICMVDLKIKICMRIIYLPLLRCCLKRYHYKYKQQKKQYSFHDGPPHIKMTGVHLIDNSFYSY